MIKSNLLAYYQADECSVSGEYQPHPNGRTGTIVESTVVVPKIDPRLNTLIGELLHDLRSSLDHLAWQLVLHTGGTPVPDKTNWHILVEAPTTNREGKYPELNVRGGVSPAARTLLNASQPYQWGPRYREHPLWLLHQLWNIDKHRYVIAKGAHTAVQLPVNLPGFRFTTRLRHCTEHGASLILTPDDPGMHVDAHTFMQVAIDEPDYGIERPLLRTLKEAYEAVEGVLTAAEATCF